MNQQSNKTRLTERLAFLLNQIKEPEMELVDLPDHLITKVNVNEYEAIQTIVNEQAREYSDILDSTEPEEIYPMVHEQLPDLDQEVALNVLRYILPTKE